MAKFTYTVDDKEANLAVKRAVDGKAAILKDGGNELKIGAPMMTVTVKLGGGVLETSASLFGKALLGTVESCIELEGTFVKQ